MNKQTTPTDDLIALCAKSASEEFRDDGSAPGVLIAHLPNGRGSVCPPDPHDTLGEGFGLEPTSDGHRDVYHEPGLEFGAPCFYVAVQRFTEPMGGGKKVIVRAFAGDLDVAVRAVAVMLAPPVDHQARLAKVVKAEGFGQ